MPLDVRVPGLGESIVEATVGQWLKQEGELVAEGEPVVELETEKVNVQVPAPEAGTLDQIVKPAGATVRPGEVLGTIREEGRPRPGPRPRGEGVAAPAPERPRPRPLPEGERVVPPPPEGVAPPRPARVTPPLPPGEGRGEGGPPRMEAPGEGRLPPSVGERVAPPLPLGEGEGEGVPRRGEGAEARPSEAPAPTSPTVRALAAEHGIDLARIPGTGRGGRVTVDDVMRYLEERRREEAGARPAGRPPGPSVPLWEEGMAPAPERPPPGPLGVGEAVAAPPPPVGERAAPPLPVGEGEGEGVPRRGEGVPLAERREERVPMSRRRQTIARRLVEAQRTAAILTTFNEVDTTAVMELRRRRRDEFERRYGVKLGLMSFFTRAVVGALRAYPIVNAEVDDDTIILKRYYDIGIAVATDEGLVVPVIRDADRRTFAEIERAIEDMATRAREGRLTPQELIGGTFTITNGGVFGSLLSTPILNSPQVGILGMHKIEDRPVAVGGQVIIRPMMYVALSYDHRIVDGRQAVLFLVRVKELIEDPERLLLEA